MMNLAAGSSSRRCVIVLAGVCASLLCAATFAGAAAAAPTLIWNTYDIKTVGSADTAGGNGRDLFTAAAFPLAVKTVNGTTADPATGRVFWSNASGNGIYSGNLEDTSQAPCQIAGSDAADATSLAYNPVNDTLYWYVWSIGFRYVKVPADCSGPAASSPLYNESNFPAQMKDVNGLAIDPANNRIYWPNGNDGTVGYANLDGTTLAGSAATITLGCSPAITSAQSVNVDPALNRLYVGAYASADAVVAASDLDGGNCSASGAGSAPPVTYGVWGVTRDTETLFAANYGTSQIKTWPLASFPGSGAVFAPGGTATITNAQFPAVIDIPAGTATVSPASAEAGADLTCSATWETGTPGMQWYRAPKGATTYSWSKDGQTIPGSTSATLKAESGGNYSCAASASNYAGTSSLTASANVSAAPTPTPTPAPTPTPTPAKPAVTWSSSTKAKSVTAVITPVAGVTYTLTATSGRVTKTGACKNVTITQGKKKLARRSCTIKLAKGKWLAAVTPKIGSVSGTASIKSYSFK